MERFRAYIKQYRETVDSILREVAEKKESEIDDRFNRIVYAEIKRFLLSPGKRIRPHLVLMGYEGVTGESPDRDVLLISTTFEILHAYLLTHDDVIDRDEVRRNQPTVWKSLEEEFKKFGATSRHTAYSMAILAGDILRSLIHEVVGQADLPYKLKSKVCSLLGRIDEVTNRGQVLDVALSFTPLNLVTEEDILRVYRYKTALYSFNGPLGLGAVLGGEDEDFYREYAIPVGIAFQIRDDILGVFGDPEVTGKPADSDIKEGKRTILVWYAWNHGSNREKAVLEKVLGNEEASEEEVQEVRDILVSTGALEYAEELARSYVSQAKEALRGLDINPDVMEMLVELADYIVERNK